MVFGLFSRKTALEDTSVRTNDQNARLPTPTPSITSIAHRSPLRFSTVLHGGSAYSHEDSNPAANDVSQVEYIDFSSLAPPPPATPSPSPVYPNETKALCDLISTIPPKTLHAYTVAHLRPQPPPPPPNFIPTTSTSSPTLGLHPDGTTPRPPSPDTVGKLIAFFSTLAPPPLLHCVRCHKDFYDIENEEKDKACRVPHDDESTSVSRLPAGGGYETLWGCCGQTASGDGSEGPPDGWCYEGMHTTDAKRARFRADSTIHDDKLTSCLKLNCRGIRDHLRSRDPIRRSPPPPAGLGFGASPARSRRSNLSPTRSQVSVVISRTARKRPRKSLRESSGSEDYEATDVAGTARTEGDEDNGGAGVTMAVNEPRSRPLKKQSTSRPVSRVRPPHSTSTTASFSVSGSTSAAVPPAVVLTQGKKARTGKPRSRATAMTAPQTCRSSTLLSQSHVHLASDSEASSSTRSRPRTRSLVREESRVRGRAVTKFTRATDASERVRRARESARQLSQSPTSEEEPERETDQHKESEEEDEEVRGRGRKRRRVKLD